MPFKVEVSAIQSTRSNRGPKCAEKRSVLFLTRRFWVIQVVPKDPNRLVLIIIISRHGRKLSLGRVDDAVSTNQRV